MNRRLFQEMRVWCKGGLMLAVALLAACGFQPRGEVPAPGADLQPLALTGLNPGHDFMRELRRQLQLAGVTLAETPDQAAAVVRIRRLDQDRRVFSVNADNKVVEYEILYRLAYRLERPPGHPLDRPDPLLARRIIYEPGGQLLGRVREAELRQQDVYADLARRLIRQLASR